MKRQIEALLFATDSPLSMARFKSLFPGTTSLEIRAALQELAAELDEQDHAFTLVEFGGGWQVASRPEYAPLIEKLFRGRRFTRLSRAGLEVLAIIAYRQPITRLEIEEIRGVQSSGVLTTLTERNLVTVVGRTEAVGHPLLYGTTREFLNHVGLRALSQLPELPEVAGLLENREELKRFASELGREFSDEDLEGWQIEEQEETGPNGPGDEGEVGDVPADDPVDDEESAGHSSERPTAAEPARNDERSLR